MPATPFGGSSTAKPVSSTETAGRGLRAILVATVVAGAFGYAIQLLAPAMLAGRSTYVAFSVFWSTLFLGISAMSGVQQEVTRAARPATNEPPSPVLRRFAIWSGGIVAVAAVVVAVLFGGKVMPTAVASFAGVLVIAFVGYLANAVLSGVLYGLNRWTPIAALIILDAAIRSVLVVSGFVLQLDTQWLALFVALPFGTSFGLVWLWIRRSVIGAYRLDVPLRGLARHTLSTVGASVASGVMITGLPMLIGLTSAQDSASAVGSLLLAITLTRAPIVVPVIAVQSFLISAVFRDGRVGPGRLLRLLGVALAAVVVIAGIGGLIGPPLVAWFSAGRFSVTGLTAALIVMSAGLVAAMCVTGPALIAARRHVANVIGWVVAATATVVMLLLPLELTPRAGAALVVPPLLGLLLHAVALLARPKAS